MLNRFRHKTVLITGGASGLGAELVTLFAKLNWQIWIADRQPEAAEKLAAKLQQDYSASISVHRCDVANETEIQALADTIKASGTPLDVIINNAGIASAGLLQQTSSDKWQRTMAVNLNGVFLCCRYFEPLLPARGPGAIVNVASFAAIAQAPAMLAYNVSKAAVVALSESLRIELGYRDITVSVACPAFFKTNLMDSLTDESPAIRSQVEKWMHHSKLSAADIASDIVKGLERGKFLIVSHGYAKRLYWFKRFFPNTYAKKLIKLVPKIIQRWQPPAVKHNEE
ncbi:MAG: SDR family NAD(P)-dependent oxidoreductase [Gammaproteobacteria bacterium]|nr:SDR family NAD(P)-dependent oxidoreductase [Gammaproteobacteria bacterium]